MFKFLRKYNKFILAVGGTLLVIVFLIPQALQGLAERAAVRGVEWAKMEDGTVLNAADRMQAERELSWLDDTGIANQLRLFVELDRPEHWYLLTREAEEAGLMMGAASIDPNVDQLAQLFASRRPTEHDFMRATLAKESSVRRLLGLYQDGGDFSDRRLQRFAERLVLTANSDIVAIAADPDAVDLDPTEGELEAQLAAFRDVAPGEGEMGFGYMLPNRFKLEWMTIDRASVSAAVKAGDELNEVALRKHWRRKADTAGIPPVQTDAAVPDEVREDLLNELTDREMREVTRFATNQLRSRLRGMKPSAGFFQLDESWDEGMMPFPEVAQLLRERFGIELPAYQTSGGDWLTVVDMQELEIGQATTDQFGAGEVLLAQVVSSIQEFGGLSTVPVQARITLPPFTDPDGDVILVRVIDTDASRPPNSVDEVRDELIADLRRKAHYDELVARLDELVRTAREDGMLDLGLEVGTPLERRSVFLNNAQLLELIINNPGFGLALTPSDLPVIGVHEDTVSTIVDRCLDYPTDVAIEDLPAEDRIFGLPVEDRLAVMVVGVNDIVPLWSELYDLLVDSRRIHQMVSTDEMDMLEDLRSTFGFDAMAQRHGFELSIPASSSDDETEGGTTAPEDARASAGS